MYMPQTPPSDPAKLPGFLFSELSRLQQELAASKDALRLDVSYVAPTKPRDGEIRLADGTSWNPGSGAGYYGYRAGSWRFLG